MTERTERYIRDFTNDIYIKITEFISAKQVLMRDLAMTMYQSGYDEGRNNACSERCGNDYEKGLEDAWEIARKIVKGYYDDLFSNYKEPVHAIRALSVHEAMKMIDEFEKKQEEDDKIKVGDEILSPNREHTYTVININSDGTYCHCIGANSEIVYFNTFDLKKTGRHFSQIAEVLEQMNCETE